MISLMSSFGVVSPVERHTAPSRGRLPTVLFPRFGGYGLWLAETDESCPAWGEILEGIAFPFESYQMFSRCKLEGGVCAGPRSKSSGSLPLELLGRDSAEPWRTIVPASSSMTNIRSATEALAFREGLPRPFPGEEACGSPSSEYARLLRVLLALENLASSS